MQNIKIEQFQGNNGAVKNQFIVKIYNESGQYDEYFQSYRSIIAVKKSDGSRILDKTYWDYSKTTGKYRNIFLGETKKDTQAKIDSGIYTLTDLNK